MLLGMGAVYKCFMKPRLASFMQRLEESSLQYILDSDDVSSVADLESCQRNNDPERLQALKVSRNFPGLFFPNLPLYKASKNELIGSSVSCFIVVGGVLEPLSLLGVDSD